MKTKEEKIKLILNGTIAIILALLIVVALIIIYKVYFPQNGISVRETAAKIESKSEKEIDDNIKISNINLIDLEETIKEDTNNEIREEITKRDEILEYLTEYKTNKEIPKGISYVVQEGRQGLQEITIKSLYDENGELISEEQIGSSIKKSPANKIVEIGGANYTSNYKVKKNDIIYVTSDILAFWSEPSEESRKITTLTKNDEVKVIEITQNWYKVSYKNMTGWIKSECTTYINPNANQVQNTDGENKTRQQLLATLNFDMQLDKPSGLSLEQFKKVLSDDRDVNNIFSNNAEYFYYIEKQYNINGVFVAAVGIHESAWGTSKIALEKTNLFGYGAYDSNPYNGAYTFKNYSESIDLIARVFVKYYLNPQGTNIYSGEVALGTYYNGKTISSVNKKYATDNNWANAVYSYMKYLYNKL